MSYDQVQPDAAAAVGARRRALSLVLLAHGDSAHFAEALRSLLEQSAVREGLASVTVTTSTPGRRAREACRFAGVPYIVSAKRDLGIGADWNAGLAQAEADLVALCHQDDLYEPGFVQAMLAVFEQHPDVVMASSAYLEIDEHGRGRRSVVHRVKRALMWISFRGRVAREAQRVRRCLLGIGNPVCCPSVVLNMAHLRGFRFSTTLHSNLDWDAWERISSGPGSLAYLDQPLVRHRVHRHSTTSALVAAQVRQREDAELLGRFWPASVAAAWLRIYGLATRQHAR